MVVYGIIAFDHVDAICMGTIYTANHPTHHAYRWRGRRTYWVLDVVQMHIATPWRGKYSRAMIANHVTVKRTWDTVITLASTYSYPTCLP